MNKQLLNSNTDIGLQQTNKDWTHTCSMPSTIINSGKRILSDAQIDTIGILHNTFLNDILSNLESNNYQNINNIITKIGNELFSQKILNLVNPNTKGINTTNLNNEVKYYIDASKKILAQSNTYAQIEIGLSQLKNKAYAQISGVNLEIVLIMISVAINSAYFWYPSNLGGSGIGYGYINNIQVSVAHGNSHQTGLVTISGIIGADLDGGAGTAAEYWIVSLEGGVVTVAAFLAGIGFGAAIASSIYILRNS